MGSRPSNRGWWLVSIAAQVFGCVEPSSLRTGQVDDDLIYGDDSRRDVYAVDDARLARIALQGTVAFLSAEHLVRDSMGGTFAIVSETLGASNHLCPGESFETQPAAATCSGVLVDDQLVLTAGHCIPEDATCGDSLLVFDYAITSPGRAVALEPEAI